MTDVVIDELILPTIVGGEGWDEFCELMAVRNEVETGTLGTDALEPTPESLLPHFIPNPQRDRRHFVARQDGRMVARGIMGWLTAEGAPWVAIGADVLPAHRRCGIGSALFTHMESLAAELGRPILQSSAIHTSSKGGARLASSTGIGDIPAHEHEPRIVSWRVTTSCRGKGVFGCRLPTRMTLLTLPAMPTSQICSKTRRDPNRPARFLAQNPPVRSEKDPTPHKGARRSLLPPKLHYPHVLYLFRCGMARSRRAERCRHNFATRNELETSSFTLAKPKSGQKMNH